MLSVLDSTHKSSQLWLLMGLKRTLSVFPVTKQLFIWDWEQGRTLMSIGMAQSNPYCQRKQVFDDYWNKFEPENPSCAQLHVTTFFVVHVRCETGKWGLSEIQRRPFRIAYHFYFQLEIICWILDLFTTQNMTQSLAFKRVFHQEVCWICQEFGGA